MSNQYSLPFDSPRDGWTPRDLISQLLEARERKLLLDVVFNKIECHARVSETGELECEGEKSFSMYHRVLFAENTPREIAVRVMNHIRVQYNLEVSLSQQEIPYQDPFVSDNPDLVSSYSAYEMRIYNKIAS